MKDLIKATRTYREQLLHDPYRPGYHFCVPDDDGRPGDPNGCFFANGRHHLMYLYRRDGGSFCWGHVSSTDLVHWRHHEDALTKGELDEGCFSGGGFVNDDGTAYISYWIFNDGGKTQNRNAGIGIAKSTPPYEHWERLPNVAIASTEWGIRDVVNEQNMVEHLGCADPSNIWKHDGVYYMQTGNLCVLNKYGREKDSPINMRGDWVELFSSADIRNWKHEGRFYQRHSDNIWTDETEDDMCPSFLPLPGSKDGGKLTTKYLQLFIAHNKGSQYYIGEYEGNHFYPESHGRMSWVDNAFFAPEAYIDNVGRQIMFAWLLDNKEKDFDVYGWSGVFSLPRTLWLDKDDKLGIAPIPELNALRYNLQNFNGIVLKNTRCLLPINNGRSCGLHIIANVDKCSKVGVAVCASSEEETIVYYDTVNSELVFDTTHAGNTPRAVREVAPLSIRNNELFDLTVYIDRSVVEVFANERQAICRRVYGKNPNAANIYIFTEGESNFTSLESWEMSPSMPY